MYWYVYSVFYILHAVRIIPFRAIFSSIQSYHIFHTLIMTLFFCNLELLQTFFVLHDIDIYRRCLNL
jgi:hypothetical protein